MSAIVKKLLVFGIVIVLMGVAGIATLLITVSSDLPKLITVEDYKPKLVSEVYARGGEKIGEFYRERRILIPYNKIPINLVHAFLAAEDDQFFQHGGINVLSIMRAAWADIRAGHRVQGGSTITQQVAKTLLLTPEKTFTRKFKEMLLAMRMEKNLSKQDILYLYLNQIYFGQGAYGVGMAAQVYFQKTVDQLKLSEMAMLAGLPQAPTRYSPVTNPKAAKDRQRYVLKRMADVGFITRAQAQEAVNEPVVINMKRNVDAAPFYVETLRQILTQRLGESTVLDGGIKVYTGVDYQRQLAAQQSVRDGLRDLDKRQGYRGAKKNLQNVGDIAAFLLKTRNQLEDDQAATRVIQPNGTVTPHGPLNLSRVDANGHRLPNIPPFVKLNQIVDGVVTKVDDDTGLVTVRFAESEGLIDIDTMAWAHKPNPQLHIGEGNITKPSQALKVGDVIEVKVVGEKFTSPRLQKLMRDRRHKLKLKLPKFDNYADLALEQEPLVEGALLSIDQQTEEVIAMVGGYDFSRNQFNRALQAARQTGSAFKVFVYSAALDKGYTPSTPIVDAPVVFQEQVEKKEGNKNVEETKTWKPGNDTKKFGGDVLFRNALIQSMNVPTVKILNDIGIDWPAEYARRLGVFSPLNMDLSMGLGTSSITLYEMTKAFSEIGRLGKRVRPLIIHKVVAPDGKVLLENVTLDDRFQKELSSLDQDFEQRRQAYLAQQTPAEPNQNQTLKVVKKNTEPPLFFQDPDQLMKPTTAYVMTDILKGVVNEGTGFGARVLGRPVAGKTGTANDYVDAWFLGFSPQIAAGVWVGFDTEKSLGRGEFGARAALPIWVEYMKAAHEGLPILSFPVPPGIVFSNIDRDTGFLASASSKKVVRQAYVDGTEPTTTTDQNKANDDSTEFLKEDLSNEGD